MLDCQTEIAAETELNLQMNGSTSAPQNKSDFKSSQKTDVVTETLNESYLGAVICLEKNGKHPIGLIEN